MNKCDHILVADDDPVLLELANSSLSSAGYRVSCAKNGIEAVALLNSREFDLLISDLDMPELDGFGLLQRVRNGDKTRHIPVIVVTSTDQFEAIERAYALGATSFMVGPAQMIVIDLQDPVSLSEIQMKQRQMPPQMVGECRVCPVILPARKERNATGLPPLHFIDMPPLKEEMDPAWRALLLRHQDRIIVGTDTYMNLSWVEYEELVAAHRQWLVLLPRAAAEKIAYRNAERLFRNHLKK